MVERSTARAWKGKQEAEGVELELPSENIALCRRIKPEAFLQGGLIPDPLTSLVMKAVNDKKGLPPAELKKIAADREKLGAAMQMMDRILCYVVMDPPVEMPPPCKQCGHYYTDKEANHDKPAAKGYHKYTEADRDPDILYSDVVSMDDKVFIFQWSTGGTADVERFREEFKRDVGAVSG